MGLCHANTCTSFFNHLRDHWYHPRSMCAHSTPVCWRRARTHQVHERVRVGHAPGGGRARSCGSASFAAGRRAQSRPGARRADRRVRARGLVRRTSGRAQTAAAGAACRATGGARRRAHVRLTPRWWQRRQTQRCSVLGLPAAAGAQQRGGSGSPHHTARLAATLPATRRKADSAREYVDLHCAYLRRTAGAQVTRVSVTRVELWHKEAARF